MSKPRTAGAIILDRLRDRIVSGVYLGIWRPGDKLPSIRDIATAESVDRKTAAAAYRRLAGEALVEIRPRSGVYVREIGPPQPRGSIERIHERWLERTYTSARELGLFTDDILRLIGSVERVEGIRVPVLECNWPQAAYIASELRRRLAIHAVPYLFGDTPSGDPLPREAPILVGTPYHRSELRRIAGTGPGSPVVVEVTAPVGLFQQLIDCAALVRTAVLVPDARLLGKIRGALERLGPRLSEPPVWVAIPDCDDPADAVRGATAAFLWPGTPEWVVNLLSAQGFRIIRPERALSDESITRVHSALLAAAVKTAGAGERNREPVHAGS